jgi:hypothetical protein
MGIEALVDLDHLTINLTGPDRVFSLKTHMEIPLSKISSVDVVERKRVPPTPGTWLRAPGTHVPGLVRHGSYGRAPQREFWAVYRQRLALVIRVEGWNYSRLVLGIKDVPLHAAEIRTAAEVHHPLEA